MTWLYYLFESVEKLQGTSVAMLAPAWIKFSNLKSKKTPSFTEEEYQQLKLENQLLRNELYQTQEELQQEIAIEYPSTTAQVIFRSPASWNSSLWINVGQADHPTIITKNSPVLLGTSVIGLIDYVGKHQARVRLITDSGLSPSVRAQRTIDNKTHLLAKGELHGSSQPLWRTKSHTLKGIGFNYDFSDEHGPSRDLRSGEPQNEKDPPIPIIEAGDLLVTTGMDGVFPPGLEVATVTTIQTLHEGDYFYELEAVPTAGNLDDLSLLFVIPPLGYDPDE